MTRATTTLLAMTAAAALTLSACARDTMTREERTAAGAAIGGVAGAVAGTHIAGDGNRTAGAIIGGVAGAATGAAVANSQ